MARSGTIIPSGVQANPTLSLAVTAGEPVVASLGGIVAAVLAAGTVKLLVVVDAVLRRVKAFSTKIGANSAVNSQLVENFTKLGVLVQDDPTKKVSSWTFTASGSPNALNAAAEAVVAASKPSLSLSSLISKLEDAIASTDAEQRLLAVADQETGEVSVFSVDQNSTLTDSKVGDGATDATIVEQVDIEQEITEGAPGVPNFAFE